MLLLLSLAFFRYLCGELLQGRTNALDKADVFALGATVYELALGSELPKSGPAYQRLRQGKLMMLPTFTTQFLNVVKVRLSAGGACSCIRYSCC